MTVDNVFPLLIAIHVVMSMALSVTGPIQVRGGNWLHNVLAYTFSLIVNVCGFWPVTLGLLLFQR